MNAKVILSIPAQVQREQLMLSKEKTAATIVRAIEQKIEVLKQFIHYGDPIAKDKIPKVYRSEFDITNLFRVELPEYYRMLYTLTNEGENRVVFILEILDHEVYNKRFGYRKMR